ncbi:MAG: transposase [Ottowia sp.]
MDRRKGLEGAGALLSGGNQGKAYDARSRVIEPLLIAGKKVVIPSRSANKERREYDKDLYKARHVIENFFARLKQWRAIATRYGKTAHNFLTAIHLVAAIIWIV